MNTFGDDVAFLRRHTDVIVLSDATGAAQIALTPALQARVMTSTADRDSGRSFGWINRDLIAADEPAAHINAFGGEDRVWLGPEGGQYSVFFARGAPFDLEHWYVPAPLDTRPFRTLGYSDDSASFDSEFTLTNYSGTQFRMNVRRDIRLLASRPASVSYESRTTLRNTGDRSWRKESGLLSIWIAGMFPASPTATLVVPIQRDGPGRAVTADYFGDVPADRLRVSNDAAFLRADANFRSKIGVTPHRSLGVLGSYDADAHVLTIVQFDQPPGVTEYVNSLWKHQDDPYAGDALNCYNDGPPASGIEQFGRFYELESSSPAAALEPGASIQHTHRTQHLVGADHELDSIARTVLGVSIDGIRTAFDGH